MPQAPENKGFIYEFGSFVLDPHERVLFSEGRPVHLADKVFDTLVLLVKRSGRLVTKDEMMAAVWDESYVEEGNIAKNVSRLRKILNSGGNELIETLPRRGYRFLGNVREIDAHTDVLVHRNLRVKITQTTDDGAELVIADRADARRWRLALLRRVSLQKMTALGAAVVLLTTVFLLVVYVGRRDNSVAAVRDTVYGAIRLTEDVGNYGYPRWTPDGRIRFLRVGVDRQMKSFIMNADGSNKTTVEDFKGLQQGIWSPNGQMVVFGKPNDKSSFYLANSDGSGEVALPFYGGNADWSPDGKRIVYQKTVSPENPDIFVYSVERGQSVKLTNDPAFDADPSFSPDGKKIVFVSTRDGNAEIYVMNDDGSNVRRLTDHPAWDNHPVFSPDGTQISFDSDRDNESSDIYLMRADGSDVRRLVDWKSNESAEGGCWSPDGTKIAFTSDRYGNDDIYVISAEAFSSRVVLADDKYDLRYPAVSPDGSRIAYEAELADHSGELRVYDIAGRRSSVLLKTDNSDTAPAWSPDGEWIAIQQRIGSNTEICLIRPDGSQSTNLTDNPARDINPAFSPDGKRIAFASNRDGNFGLFQLYEMNMDGSDTRRIFYSKALSGSPSWSPDGREIVFANDQEGGRIGNFEIYKIDAENGEIEKRLTFRRWIDTEPAYSPDGKRIAFTSNEDGNSEIYLMNSDGSGLLRLTRNAADDTNPRWSPNGQSIIFSSNRDGKFAIYEIQVPQ